MAYFIIRAVQCTVGLLFVLMPLALLTFRKGQRSRWTMEQQVWPAVKPIAMIRVGPDKAAISRSQHLPPHLLLYFLAIG